MNAAEALMIASICTGSKARLVSRPGGVPHVHCGRLTRSGRHVPFAGGPVCRQRTKQLSVHRRDGRAPHRLRPLSRAQVGSIERGWSVAYLCRRCVATLARWSSTVTLPTAGPGVAAPRGRRTDQLPDLEALVGALRFVRSHEELHAADRCVIAGLPQYSVGALLGQVPLSLRGSKVSVIGLYRDAKREHPNLACCPVSRPVGVFDGLGSIAEARRAQRERLGVGRYC